MNKTRQQPYLWGILLFLLLLSACRKKEETISSPWELTIFTINDIHGRIDAFPKLKALIEAEEKRNAVILTAAGDVFSGNPVVDNYRKRGYPMIDLMNRTGVDVASLGNHEFDYGQDILRKRIRQSDFPWLCANVETTSSLLPQPPAYAEITAGDLRLLFLGMVETYGKADAVMPSTHPWKLENLTFSPYYKITDQYAHLKSEQKADLYIALSHLGEYADFRLAGNYPFFDLIIGGHSHSLTDTIINEIPIFHAGGNFRYAGRLRIDYEEGEVRQLEYELIRMDTVSVADRRLSRRVRRYNAKAQMEEVLGYAETALTKSQVGCLYTDALRIQQGVDVVFQNSGGVRSGLDQGDITKKEIYTIDPFNNGFVRMKMSVDEIIGFLKNSGEGLYYSGISLDQTEEGDIELCREGEKLAGNTLLTLGINDYIAAVNDRWLPDEHELVPLNTAEIIIAYLEQLEAKVDYADCDRYFRYQRKQDKQ